MLRAKVDDAKKSKAMARRGEAMQSKATGTIEME